MLLGVNGPRQESAMEVIERGSEVDDRNHCS
jgi:hypothetical protein